MSYEVMSDKEYPCDCGKGTYRVIMEMDDWNRTRDHTTLNCVDCARKKREAEMERQNEKDSLIQLDNETAVYFADRYMQDWRNYFAGAKTKKEIWLLMNTVGIENSNLPRFYRHSKNLNMTSYIERKARHYNILKIMAALNIEDDYLKSQVEKANVLYDAEQSRLYNAAYRRYRMK